MLYYRIECRLAIDLASPVVLHDPYLCLTPQCYFLTVPGLSPLGSFLGASKKGASVTSPSQFEKKPAPFGTVLEQSAAVHVNSVLANVPAAQVCTWSLLPLLSVYPAPARHCMSACTVRYPSQAHHSLQRSQHRSVQCSSSQQQCTSTVFLRMSSLHKCTRGHYHCCCLCTRHCISGCTVTVAPVTSASQFVDKPAPFGINTVLEQSAAVHVNSVPANVPAAQVYAWPSPLLLSVHPALHV